MKCPLGSLMPIQQPFMPTRPPNSTCVPRWSHYHHSAMNIDSRAANEYTLGTQEVPYAYPNPNYETDNLENQGTQGN